jgi:hypothetical protein
MKQLAIFVLILAASFSPAIIFSESRRVVLIEEEWKCSKCGLHNYEGTTECYYCKTPK